MNLQKSKKARAPPGGSGPVNRVHSPHLPLPLPLILHWSVWAVSPVGILACTARARSPHIENALAQCNVYGRVGRKK